MIVLVVTSCFHTPLSKQKPLKTNSVKKTLEQSHLWIIPYTYSFGTLAVQIENILLIKQFMGSGLNVTAIVLTWPLSCY